MPRKTMITVLMEDCNGFSQDLYKKLIDGLQLHMVECTCGRKGCLILEGGIGMPVYKDEKNNTWYCKFYRSDLDGTRKQTTKRGFPTKKAAQQWEREAKAADSADMNVTLETFVNMYFEDKKGELKDRSINGCAHYSLSWQKENE